MQTLNSSELTFLAVIGHPELTTKVLRVYSEKMYIFSGMFTTHLDMMWKAYVALLKKYRQQYGLKLSVDIIAAGLSDAVQADASMPQDLKTKCDAILQKLVSGDIPDLAQGEQLVKTMMALETNRNMVAKIQSNADLVELQQSLDAAKRTMSTLDDDKPKEGAVDIMFRPFRDIKKLARRVVRIPTGINWLDDISNGGGRAGELWLVLGAPSSGKSIFCVQYACAQAMLGTDTVWATYEQSLEGDLAERMIANITDTSLDHIRDVGFENLPQDIQDKFWTAVAGVDDRLIGLDMSRIEPDPQDPEDYGGIASIWKRFRQLKDEGRAPKTVIIDWFGAMMVKMAANLHIDLAQCYRFKAQQEIMTLLKMAKEEKVLVIVMHQADSKTAAARPTYLSDATHAQDMHNLQNFFDLVAIIGKKDINNILYFSNPKARKGGNIVRTLHMIGEKSRFVMEDGWLPNKDGNFYRPADTGSVDVRGMARQYTRELE